MDGLVVVTQPMNPLERAFAEAMVADFIKTFRESDSEEGVFMAQGAAIALACFVNVKRAMSADDAAGVLDQGLAAADDINASHEASHRIGSLITDVPEKEFGAFMDQVDIGRAETRTEALRRLEALILERKLEDG